MDGLQKLNNQILHQHEEGYTADEISLQLRKPVDYIRSVTNECNAVGRVADRDNPTTQVWFSARRSRR